MEALQRFVRDALLGKVAAYVKSQPIPDKNDGAVKIVVAQNFRQIVHDESKDVLIQFYDPWCPHCRRLRPKYRELAARLANRNDIIIAKMDVTANSVLSRYTIKAVPTIYFSPKGSKDSPIMYSGGRRVEDFLRFLAKETRNGMSVSVSPRRERDSSEQRGNNREQEKRPYSPYSRR